MPLSPPLSSLRPRGVPCPCPSCGAGFGGSGRKPVEDAGPAAGTLAEGAHIVLLVRRVDAVVVEPEADQKAFHAERVLEGRHDRDRAAYADQRRRATPLLLECRGGADDVGQQRVEG